MQVDPLLLIIDDEQAILKTLKDALRDESFRVETLADGKKAIAAIGKLIPDLILLDIFMPDCNGLELLKQIVQEFPQQKVIMISGFGTIQLAIEAVKEGALDFIEKPFNLDDILAKLEFLKLPPPQHPAPHPSIHEDCGIIGKSHHFAEIMRQVSLVAPLPIPVLLYGAHGVGKSTIAAFMHQASSLSTGSLITLDCSTIAIEEAESLLHQYQAHPCTLYIKSINHLPIVVQQLLARLLERPVAARIIASSTEPLFPLLKDHRFNPALFARLHTLPLEIPSLKKRPGDTPLLIDHYARRFNQELGKSVVLTTRTVRLLSNRTWHQNIRELQRYLHQIILMAPTADYVVGPNDLLSLFGERDIQVVEEQQFSSFMSLGDAVANFEKNFLLYLLKKNHYNVEQVAFQLNISAPELRTKISTYNIL